QTECIRRADVERVDLVVELVGDLDAVRIGERLHVAEGVIRYRAGRRGGAAYGPGHRVLPTEHRVGQRLHRPRERAVGRVALAQQRAAGAGLDLVRLDHEKARDLSIPDRISDLG